MFLYSSPTLKCFQALWTCCCVGCIHYWFHSSYLCLCFFHTGWSCWILLLWTSHFTTCRMVIQNDCGFSQWFEWKLYEALLWSIQVNPSVPASLSPLPEWNSGYSFSWLSSDHSSSLKPAVFQSLVWGGRLDFECFSLLNCIGRRRWKDSSTHPDADLDVNSSSSSFSWMCLLSKQRQWVSWIQPVKYQLDHFP